VYVVRIMKNGSYGYSKPCEGCIEEMKKWGIYRVYYSLDSEEGELLYSMEKVSEIKGLPSSGSRRARW